MRAWGRRWLGGVGWIVSRIALLAYEMKSRVGAKVSAFDQLMMLLLRRSLCCRVRWVLRRVCSGIALRILHGAP